MAMFTFPTNKLNFYQASWLLKSHMRTGEQLPLVCLQIPLLPYSRKCLCSSQLLEDNLCSHDLESVEKAVEFI